MYGARRIPETMLTPTPNQLHKTLWRKRWLRYGVTPAGVEAMTFTVTNGAAEDDRPGGLSYIANGAAVKSNPRRRPGGRIRCRQLCRRPGTTRSGRRRIRPTPQAACPARVCVVWNGWRPSAVPAAMTPSSPDVRILNPEGVGRLLRNIVWSIGGRS